MEDTFVRLWGDRIHRITGVDGANETQVFEMIGEDLVGKKVWDIHANSIGGAGALGCILSHLRAVRTAYLAGPWLKR